MYKFKSGDKVKCINPSGNLIKGNTYTIKGYDEEESPHTSLVFIDLYRVSYFDHRFELIAKDSEAKEELTKTIKQSVGWGF
jgi:hypothetical protein